MRIVFTVSNISLMEESDKYHLNPGIKVYIIGNTASKNHVFLVWGSENVTLLWYSLSKMHIVDSNHEEAFDRP